MQKIILSFVFLFSLQACQSSQELRVRRLALVDAKGTERLILTTESSDVRINGKIYKRRSPAAGIILQNAKGDEVGGVAMLDDGTASFTLDGYSADGVNERASLYVLPDGRSGVLVKDSKGKIRAKMEVDPERNSVLQLAGEDEAPKVLAKVTADGKATIDHSPKPNKKTKNP